MWNKINLRNRIYLILTSLVLITFAGGLVMVWYTYKIEGLLTSIIDKNLAAYQAAQELETALVNQKGFVSYYFLDSDPEWLRKLGEYRQIFKERLNQVRRLVNSEQQKKTVDRISLEYGQYIIAKDRVIALYKAGEYKAGAKLHQKVRKRFFTILDLCSQYKNIHTKSIIIARKESSARAGNLRIVAASAMFIDFLLALFLVIVFAKYILGPVRSLTKELSKTGGFDMSGNEIKALRSSVRGLIDDVDQTHWELEKSREHLQQAEKMAMVGKLAAGMAHSIRNPFTSVKMRMFSLGRYLDLSSNQKEDFEVISEEIRHIDTILQNFLEFSRPPKLKIQQVSPSVIVDLVIQLLEHRLKSYDVKIKVLRKDPLPEIEADPEQLKEVIVNIVINACESMDGGGIIEIDEKEEFIKALGNVVILTINDNGLGIPEAIQDKVFQPFFTTKEEGTGLGLSIVERIIKEHGGTIELSSKEGQGSTFIITLLNKGLKS
ncbi:MAG: MCP four helix bundle domain-containing protein [Deltaproteobacteria bacterium]|nr:MCP four helix bundle domain-containing protein [Deltaproteobacteria bacterium]